MTETTLYRECVLAEIDTLPDEYLPFVLRGCICCGKASRSNLRLQVCGKVGPRRGRVWLTQWMGFGMALMPNEPKTPAPREFGSHLNSSATSTSLQKSITGFKIVQMKVGSHLYGTATPESDLDIKAVYIPSARDILLQRVSPVMSESRPKPRGEKNTSADTDCEAFSLQRYLELLTDGQTVALDMLFAPDWAMLEPPHALWREIQALAPRLMTKGTTAMVRYCRQQANKYGIKGLRVAAARATLGVL